MTKYKEFASRFHSSGLTQKAFAIKEGISASMVSYYLKVSKEQSKPTFTALQIENLPKQEYIHITTSQGTEIKIPL